MLVQRQRAEEIEGAEVPPFVEPSGQHPNHFMRLSVEADGAADDIPSGAETLLPTTLTQDDYVVASSYVFPWEKVAAELRLDSKDGKEVRCDPKGANYLGGLARFRQARIAKGISADLTVTLHLATKIEIVRG